MATEKQGKEEVKETKQSQSSPGPKTEGSKQKKDGASKKKSDSTGKLKKLQEELNDQKEKYLRLSAEFDNYRKRSLKEKMDLSKMAGAQIFLKILPVVDDLDRAMKSIQESKDLDAVKQGIELIYEKFKEYLDQQGLKEIEALHQEFNTDMHEAVTKFPTENDELKGKVVDVIEKGYMLNDKVIRYAKVVIGE